MSATVESEAPAVEVAPAPVPVEPKKTDKPVREKKPRVPKENKPKVPKEKKPKQPKTASHPPYFQMIKEALLALSDKSGSSPYAIAKYMEEKHKAVLPANFKKMLTLQLKNSVSRGKLIKIKASYKLSETGKKEKVTARVSKTTAVKKTKTASVNNAPRETRASSKKPKPEKAKKATTVAKKKTKKSTPVKPKQPKSIKSPAAKKAKKVAA